MGHSTHFLLLLLKLYVSARMGELYRVIYSQVDPQRSDESLSPLEGFSFLGSLRTNCRQIASRVIFEAAKTIQPALS